MPQGCPVRARGKVYPSVKEAAAALGYSKKSAHRHLQTYGHLDYLGVTRPWQRPDKWRSVKIGGTAYESVTAAAKALGVDRKTIRNAEAGRPHALETVLRAAMQRSPKPERGDL